MAGHYGRRWLAGQRDQYTRTALVIGLTFAALVAPVQVLVGDWAARTVAEKQPVKLAAFEGLTETTKGAPFHLGGYYSESDRELKGGVPIPKLLSILAFHDPNATVKGLDTVPVDDQPPVNIVRYSFLAMVTIGTALMGLGLWYLALWWRRRSLPESKWFYRALSAAGPLSIVALICGWVTTEVGRQPWIVYEVMRTEQAVTDAGGMWVVFGVMCVVYGGLLAAAWWLLQAPERHAADGGGCPGDAGRGLDGDRPGRPGRLRRAGRRRLRRRGVGPDRRRRQAGRARARDGAALDEPGVGGQPRVADPGASWCSGPPSRWRSARSSRPCTSRCSAPTIGIIFRGAAFALRGQAATIGEARGLGADVRAGVAAGALLPGHGAGRDRVRPGAGGQRRPATPGARG